MKKIFLLAVLICGLFPYFETNQLKFYGNNLYAQTEGSGVETECAGVNSELIESNADYDLYEECGTVVVCETGELLKETDCHSIYEYHDDDNDDGGGGGEDPPTPPSGGGVGGGTPETPKAPCPTTAQDIKNAFPTIPNATAIDLRDILNEYMEDFGINTEDQLQHFLGQAGHETGGFSNLGVTENLNYSTQGLLKTWPSRFSQTDPNKEDPDDYAYDQEKIANLVYGNRIGNTQSGDGYKYRGRGIFQLTGKANYQEFQNFYNQKYNPDINLISNPDLLISNHELSVISALWFYQKKVLDKMTVDGNTSVEAVSQKVNKYDRNGLPDRKLKYNSAKQNINCND